MKRINNIHTRKSDEDIVRKRAEADALIKDIQKLITSRDQDEIQRILGSMYEISKSDNRIALDVLARIDPLEIMTSRRRGIFRRNDNILSDFVFYDTNSLGREGRVCQMIVCQILSVRGCVASNRSTSSDTLRNLATRSLMAGVDEGIDTTLQRKIIDNPNTPADAIAYIAKGSRYDAVREDADERLRSRYREFRENESLREMWGSFLRNR